MKGDRNKVSAVSIVLPEVARSKEGHEFDPSAEIWPVVDQTQTFDFKFDELAGYFDNSLIFQYKVAIMYYIENHSLSHAANMHKYLLNMCRAVLSPQDPVASISSTHIINYKAHIGKKEWFLGSLKGFFLAWNKLGYPGIDGDAVRLLRGMRLKGNPKGNAVRTMDPRKGPFTENELLSIHEELCIKYKSGGIGNREFALVWLFLALGMRVVQFAMLKVADFQTITADDSSVRYTLNMPRAKQRGGMARELFSPQLLCTEAGAAVSIWVEQVKSSKEGKGIKPGDLPIFPRWGHESPIGHHHMTSTMLGRELQDVVNSLQVISERTGELIKANTHRFKYTIGSRAAEEGHGELTIAKMLDHSDTQNIGVYIESTPKLAGIIDKAMAPYMAPVAQAFKGMIIRTEQDFPNGLRIGAGDPDSPAVGKCGHHGFCGAAAPHVCYTCIQFNAWLDGPHEEVLKELVDERARVLAATGDERIAAAKDRVIMAVTQVVEKCKELKRGEAING
jgi:hypothetical protein